MENLIPYTRVSSSSRPTPATPTTVGCINRGLYKWPPAGVVDTAGTPSVEIRDSGGRQVQKSAASNRCESRNIFLAGCLAMHVQHSEVYEDSVY